MKNIYLWVYTLWVWLHLRVFDSWLHPCAICCIVFSFIYIFIYNFIHLLTLFNLWCCLEHLVIVSYLICIVNKAFMNSICHLYIYMYLFVMYLYGRWALHDKEPSSLDDSKAKADWHVVTPDVRGCGPKSPGAISRSQLPTGMSKTEHQSVEFVSPL